MDVDEKNSTGELVAYNTSMPHDTNGLVAPEKEGLQPDTKASMLMANALLLGWDEMDVDAKNSTGELVAYNTPMPHDTNGRVIYTPVTSVDGAPVDGPARFLIVSGNCACRVDGMGNNHSKFVNGMKAAVGWLVDKSGIPINAAVIDFSKA